MNGSELEIVRYRVVYSDRVRHTLKALVGRAVDAGHGIAVLEALKVLDARLRIYPQFGEQRRDLSMAGLSEWDAVFPPLFVEYVLDEPNRTVNIVRPIKALPHAGFQ